MTDMIILTKLNGQKFALNNRLIETIQENPDTTIKLSNGNVYSRRADGNCFKYDNNV